MKPYSESQLNALEKIPGEVLGRCDCKADLRASRMRGWILALPS